MQSENTDDLQEIYRNSCAAADEVRNLLDRDVVYVPNRPNPDDKVRVPYQVRGNQSMENTVLDRNYVQHDTPVRVPNTMALQQEYQLCIPSSPGLDIDVDNRSDKDLPSSNS